MQQRADLTQVAAPMLSVAARRARDISHRNYQYDVYDKQM